METYTAASTGLDGLDRIIDRLRLGDNVVWQVDSVEHYREMVRPYVTRAAQQGRRLHYVRFAAHPPVLDDTDIAAAGVVVHEVDPALGFERFATAVHRLIGDGGTGAFYVFDSLTDLLPQWHSDLAVMNLFKVTCPYLYELDTIAYFALIRGVHTVTTIAGIRETTQLLLDLHHIDDRTYVHPLKVWGRHSPTMFFPHLVCGDEVTSITSSEAAARLFASLERSLDPPDHWRLLLDRARAALTSGPAERAEAERLLTDVLIGREGRMVDLCRRHLRLPDLLAIATREIGTGYIGGKSVGMLVARAILAADPHIAPRLEPHDSYYLGSDLFYTYIVANGWWKRWTEQKTPQGYFTAGARLREHLAHGRFPRPVREQFLHMLEYFGASPIIVRSSSLLEDNFGNAFAGKYESVFCANQGTPEERHRAFEDAVRTVYASAMSEEALAYRRHRGLDENDEQMAILVQRVSGDHHGEVFFPHAAGVGNSSNLYVWDPRVDMDAGMVRLVLGLGTRAVDRTVQDYARIVPLDDPTRPRPGDSARYTQRFADVLSLTRNDLITIPVEDALSADTTADPQLFRSIDQEALRRTRERAQGRGPRGRGRAPAAPTPQVVDFAGLLTHTDVPDLLRRALHTLARAYDYPVDIEFTLNADTAGTFTMNLVQCRPLQTRGLGRAVAMPPDGDPDGCLFASRGSFMGGNARLPLDHVVMVRPDAYLALGQQERHAVARGIGVVGRALAGSPYALMGPGRWGTSTPGLGVPAHFTELAPATVLVEMTYPAADFRPELSYGSHFFQDLVEAGIFYVALFDGRPGVVVNTHHLLDRPNLLADIAPTAADLAGVIHVAHLDDLVLYADIGTQRVVCR